MRGTFQKILGLAVILCLILFVGCKKKNLPPDVPATPSGPTTGHIGVYYNFSTSTLDPDGDSVSYQFDWGTGDSSAWGEFESDGIPIMIANSWLTPGIFLIKARARDKENLLSDWSPSCSLNIGPNHSPNPPSIPNGPSGGAIDTLYSYTVSTVDPDGDSVFYQFDWGDGDTSDWSVFVASNQSVTMSKSWSTIGTYYIRARAKDNLGSISDLSDSLAISIRLKWRYQAEGSILGSPAIGLDGTIYFGANDDCLYALNPDGSLKWKYQTSGDIHSPAIGADGTIFSGSRDSFFYALNSDGSFKWRFQTEGKILSSPAIGTDGSIYFGSYDSSFYALNQDGILKWQYQTNGKIRSSPAISSDGTIYFESGDRYLYALNPDGSLKWRFHTDYGISSSPAIGTDGTIYFGSYDNYLYALNPDSTLKWRFQTSAEVPFSLAIGQDGAVYFGSDNNLYAVNSDGTLRWWYDLSQASSPLIGSDGTIYIGSHDKFYAFDSDGTVKWIYPGGSSSPTINTDGTIYVGSGSYLYALYGSGQLANTAWPKFRHDLRNTGNFNGK
jgi:outer membrane protein assembly factor BamB